MLGPERRRSAWRSVSEALEPFPAIAPKNIAQWKAVRAQHRVEVASALANSRVCLALQPAVKANAPTTCAFWDGIACIIDSRGHLIPAARLMPMIENTALSQALNLRVLDLAFDTLRRSPGLLLSLPVDPCIADDQAWHARLAGAAVMQPDCCPRLIVQVSGFEMVRPNGPKSGFIDHLHASGVSVALASYGRPTSVLRLFPSCQFDMICIDGALVAGIASSEKGRVEVAALAAASRYLDITTVAERVESAADAKALKELGVDCLKGHLFGDYQVFSQEHQRAWRAGGKQAASVLRASRDAGVR